MKKTLNTALLGVLCFCLVACSSLKFPGVYRLKIAQGNYIEQDMIDQLETGMTKDQVRYVMGTPLVQDSFNPDRWDYFYNIRLADETLRKYHFTIFFDEAGTLAKWEGDYEPNKQSRKENEAEAVEQSEKREAAEFKSNDERRF